MSSTAPTPAPFRERLLPSPGVHLVALGAGLSLGLLVLPFNEVAAVVTTVLGAALIMAALVIGAPVIEVSPGSGELRAGRASIPLRHLGQAEVLDREAMRAALGPDADVRAWVCHRPWLHTAVRVAVVDPRDPTPYWLLGTRNPARLHAALGGASSAGGQAAHSEQIS